MRTLIKTVETYRVDTEADVRPFIEEQKELGREEGYDVITYTSDYKEKKKKGEVIDSAYMVTIKKSYNPFWQESYEE